MSISPSHRPSPWLVIAALVPWLACATAEPRAPHAGIARLWRDYRTLPPERALALAGDPDGLWVGAAGGGGSSRVEAEQKALSACRKQRAARRLQAPCRLYASGDEVVWEGPR